VQTGRKICSLFLYTIDTADSSETLVPDYMTSHPTRM